MTPYETRSMRALAALRMVWVSAVWMAVEMLATWCVNCKKTPECVIICEWAVNTSRLLLGTQETGVAEGRVRVASAVKTNCVRAVFSCMRLALLSLSLGLHRLSDFPRAIKTIQRFS
jgi:hypothetical protein